MQTTTALLAVMAVATLVAPGDCLGGGSSWEHLGPRNIFDDDSNHGEAGTLATASTPAGSPHIIYTGGMNNGASSGVMKTVDMGMHWVQASKGLYDTRISGVFVNPADDNHVYAGTPSGIYESLDAAASWKLIAETQAFGMAKSFRNGTIGGKPYILVATSKGIANIPTAKGGEWNVITTPIGSWNTPLSVANDGENTAVVGCAGNVVMLEIKNTTGGDFTSYKGVTCAQAAVHPYDKTQWLYSNTSGFKVYGSNDGGKTTQSLNFPSGCFYVAIDRMGWFYTGAEAGAYRSMDGFASTKTSWESYSITMHSRANFTDNRVPEDYQRIVVDFGNSVAFPSDQGLFIKPWGEDKDLTLVNACGNMSNNIAITLAISEGYEGENYMVMTVWDWNVIGSWNSGKNWPATPCAYWDEPNNCQGAPGAIGEGGEAYAFGKSNWMVLLHYHNIYFSSQGGKNTTLLRLPPQAVAHGSDVVYTRQKGSRTEPDGNVFTVMKCDDVCTSPVDGTRRSYVDTSTLPQDEVPVESMLYYTETGRLTDKRKAGNAGPKDPHTGLHTDASLDSVDSSQSSQSSLSGSMEWVLTSNNFGQHWTWTKFPAFLAGVSSIAVNPTDASTIYAVASNCLSTSTDKGQSWSPCMAAAGGLTGRFSSLVIKDSKTMIMLRSGDVPLRTSDGGKTWKKLGSAAKVSTTYSQSAVYSWSGKTLMMHGKDQSAPSRGEYAAFVWKSTDDGDTWTDETGDIITMAPNQGVWFEDDFFLTSSGEGIMVKRGMDGV